MNVFSERTSCGLAKLSSALPQGKRANIEKITSMHRRHPALLARGASLSNLLFIVTKGCSKTQLIYNSILFLTTEL
jgi:hypothetical protein